MFRHEIVTVVGEKTALPCDMAENLPNERKFYFIILNETISQKQETESTILLCKVVRVFVSSLDLNYY